MNPRTVRTLSKALGILILSLILLSAGALSWLQSETGSRWLLNRIQESARSQPGVKLELQEGRFTLLSGFELRGIKASILRDGMDIQIEVPRFEAHYSIGFLARSLTLKQLTIEGLTVAGTLALPENPPQDPVEPEKATPSIQELISSPPILAELQDIRFQNASINLKLDRPGAHALSGTIQLVNAEGALTGNLLPGKIQGRLNFNLQGAANRIALSTTTPNLDGQPSSRDTVGFSPGAVMDVAFDLAAPSRASDSWTFNLRGDQNLIRVSDFLFSRVFDDRKLAPWKITFKEQSLEAGVQAVSEKINLVLKQSGSPILVKMERSLPAIQPRFYAQLSTSPDFRTFAFDTSLSVNQVRVFQGGAKGSVSPEGTRIAFSGNLHSEPRLATFAPSLKAYPALDLGMSTDINIESADSQRSRKVTMKNLSGSILGTPFLDSSLTANLSKEGATAEGALDLKLPPSLFGFLKKAGLWDSAKKPILIEAEKALLPAGLSTRFKVTQDTSGSLSWQGRSTFKGMGPVAGISFDQPMEFDHTFTKSTPPGAAESKGTFSAIIPHATWKDEIDARDTHFESRFSMRGESNPQLELDWSLDQKSLTARDPVSRNSIPLKGLQSRGQISINDQGSISGKNLSLSLHENLFRVEANLSGNQRTGRAELSGTSQIQVPARFPDIAGNHLAGRMEFPWTVQVRDGREILLQGELRFQDLLWSNGKYGFKGLSGKIPMTEALLRDANGIHLARIETPNAFERVDFERIQPYLLESQKMSLLEIQYEDRKIGPFFGFLSIYQNLISVNQFNLKMGTEGRAYGEFYLDANPEQLQMGMLSRITGLDLDEVLPARMLKRSAPGSKRVAGRTGLVMNLTKNSVNGRIDITEIGGSQLVTLMRALDPKGKDEKINRAAAALGIAYPTFVGMMFNNGQLDMKIDMSLPAPSMTIRGIPIAGSVASTFAPVRSLLARAGYSAITPSP